MEENILKRRQSEEYIHERLEKDILFKRMALKKQKKYKDKVRVSNMEYNFLQYSYMIRQWARRNYNLTARQLDVLLYIYPLNVFTTTQFGEALKEMGINDYTMFKKMKDDGWVVLWTKSGNKRYHTLSHKANELIKRMHKMFMLEEEIPMSERRNVVVRSRKKSDRQLTDLFKLFNDKVKSNN